MAKSKDNNCLHQSLDLNKKKLKRMVEGLKNNISFKNANIASVDNNCQHKECLDVCICNTFKTPSLHKFTQTDQQPSLSEIVTNKNLINKKIRKLIIQLYNLKKEEDN